MIPASPYECVVVGSGPGGCVAAIRAAQLGLKTAVVEKGDIGGRCLNVACIPAKAVLRAADVLSEIREAGEFGITVGNREVDFAAVSERRLRVISTLTGGVTGLLKQNSIDVIEGKASPTADGNVVVGGQTIEVTRGVILATGSVKRPIPGTSFEGPVIGSEEVWALSELPRSIVVVGAGASGAEIASAYARTGSEVTLFERLDRVLPSEDVDISTVAERGLKKQGIGVHTKTFVENVVAEADRVTFSDGSEPRDAEWLVIAAGRAPELEGLGLQAAGVKLTGGGWVEVDGAMRTSVKGVWAIDDTVHGLALAHKASDEGTIAAEDIAGRPTHPLIYLDIPRATFCTPNVASSGLTEAQVRAQGYDVVVGELQYGAIGAGTVYGDCTGLIKVVGEKKHGELLGGHIVGAKATELAHELVNVRAVEGGYPEVARIVHGRPTLSEGVMEAARAADGWLTNG
jgi:dihydrolipoamide dehydrogenase